MLNGMFRTIRVNHLYSPKYQEVDQFMRRVIKPQNTPSKDGAFRDRDFDFLSLTIFRP